MKLRQISFKIISMVMVFTMLFGMSATTISAVAEVMDLNFFTTGSENSESTEDKKTINYVSLGDSMTNGFGLYGYQPDDNPIANGYLQVAPASYPAKFAAYLAGYNDTINAGQTEYIGSKGTVNLTQLAMSGMRPEDALFALSYDWQNADHSFGVTEEEFAELGIGDYHTWDEFVDGKFDNNMSGWRCYTLSYYCTVCEQTFKGTWKGNPYNDSVVRIDDICEHVQGHPNAVADADVLNWHNVGGPKIEIQKGDPRVVEYKYIIPYNSYPVANQNGNVWYGNGSAATAAQYQNAIKNADIISICLGNANFGVVMLARLLSANGVMQGFGANDYCACYDESCGDANHTPGHWVFDIQNYDYQEYKKTISDPTILSVAEEAEKLVFDYYGITGYEETKDYATANLVLHTTVSYMISYRAMLDRIAELNPDVEIVIVGNMNAMSGMKMDMGNGEVVDLQEEMEGIFGLINDYIAGLATVLNELDPDHKDITYYYAEEPTVDVLVNHFAEEINGDNVLRDRFIEEYLGRIVYMMAEKMVSLGLNPTLAITRAEVEEYIAYYHGDKATLDLPYDKAYQCAIYYAFERAIIEGSQSGMMYNEAIESTSNGFGAVFAPINTVLDNTLGAVFAHAGASAKAFRDSLPANGYQQQFDGTVPAVMEQQKCDEALATIITHYIFTAGNGNPPKTVGEVMAWITTNYEADTETQSNNVLFDVTSGLHDVMGNPDDEMFPTLLGMFGRMIVGTGVGQHPSAEGHVELYNAVVASYGNYTAGDKTEENIEIYLEKFYNFLKNDESKTAEEKVELLEKLYSVIKDNSSLEENPDVAVLELIYRTLDENGLITDEQIIAIILYAYDCLADRDLSEEDKINIAKYVYETLLYNPLLTDTQRVAIIGKITYILKNNGYLNNYAALEVVEELYNALAAEELINDAQTYAIVDYVYTVLADGVNDADYLDIIAFVYNTLIKNEAPARAARSVALSDEAKAVLTLKIVISVVAEHYIDDAENQEVIETLITGEGALINDQLLLALADNLVNIIEEEATSQAELLEKAVKTTVEIVANDSNTDASIKLQIAEVLTKAAENNGWLGGVEENPEMSKLLVVKKLYNRLTEAGLLTEAQVNNIIDYLYPILTSGEALDKDQVAEVVTYVYNVIFANGFELEAGIDMATIVCFTLMEEEIITMEDIKEILKGSYSYVLEYYDDAYAYAYEYYRDYIVAIQNEIGSVRAELMNVIALVQKSDIECAELEGLKEELIGELHLLNVTLGSISELLGNDNLTEDFESIMEELKRLEALAVQHYERLTTIVEIILPVAKEKGEAYLAETLTALQTYVEEYITTKVNDAINSLYVSVKEQVLSYLADKADMLYNKLYTYVTELVKHYASTKEGQIILAWLENHQEVLFDLYEEYGDELMAYLEEYGEIVVELLNDMVEEYGDDVLDAISAYIDEIMPTIVSWIEMHEAYAKDLIKAYIATIVHSFDALKHPELGLPAHPDFSKLTESYDKIFGLSMELLDLMNSGDFDYDNATALVQELKAEIMGLESIVKELLKNTALDINAVLQQNIENIQAEIKAQIERLEEAKKTADEELQQAIQDQINALDKELANLLEISASYGEDALAQLDKYLQEKVEYYLELAINELVKFVEDAVRGEIAPEDNSNFVSVNGGNALYADLLKAYIEGRYPGEHSYKVMLEKMTWDNLNYDALADADLITLGFDENELSGFAVEQLLGYVSNYIQTTLKDSALKYSEETIDSVASYMAELLTYSIAGKEPTTLVKPSHVEQFKTIATEIVNGFVNGLVGEGEIPTSVQVGDNVFDLNLGEHAATLEIVGNILADNEVVELDWAGLIGEKYVHHIDLAMDALRNKLLENGISETATYAIPLDEYFASTIEPKVRELIYDAIQMVNVNEFTKPVYDDLMNLYGTLDFTGLVKDFTIEIPVLDAIMCAAESYLYRNVEFQIEYGKLIYNLYETNPEATLILIGHYNPYDMAFTLGDVSVDLTEAYSYVAGIASVQPFVYALLSEKVLYVDIYDAETNYDAAVNAGLPHSLESFLKMYLMDLNPTDLSEAGNKYVADKIQNLLTVGCDNHKYSSPCDEDCDRCGATRLVPGHQYDDCEDEYCNLCNEHRVAPGHEYGEDGKCIHCGHVRPGNPDYPVVRPDDPTPLDPQCIAGTHFFDDCDDTTCHKCNYERTAPGHKFDCETGKCANCDKAIEPTGHVYLYACSETCELCGKANPNKVMHSGNNCRDTACKYCGTTIMATKHNYTSWTIIEATRENNGYEYRSCKLCGLYEVKVIRAFGTLSDGAIAGIVIGSVVVAGAAGFAIYWFLIQKKTFEALLETIKALVAKLSTPAAPVAEAAAPAPEAEAEAPATEEETK